MTQKTIGRKQIQTQHFAHAHPSSQCTEIQVPMCYHEMNVQAKSIYYLKGNLIDKFDSPLSAGPFMEAVFY